MQAARSGNSVARLQPGEELLEIAGDPHAHRAARLLRGAAKGRQQDGIFQRQQRFRNPRLVLVDIEPGATHYPTTVACLGDPPLENLVFPGLATECSPARRSWAARVAQ